MKNVVIVDDSLIGYACGYIAWKNLVQTNTKIYSLGKDSFDVLNLDLDKETNLYLLNFIYKKSITYSISIKVNKINIIFNSVNCDPNIIEDINNLTIVCGNKSVIKDCWEFFNPEENEYPKPLEIIDNSKSNLNDYESKCFYNGLIRLNMRDDYEMWDKALNSDKVFSEIVNLGKAVTPKLL